MGEEVGVLEGGRGDRGSLNICERPLCISVAREVAERCRGRPERDK
jgi:hypothetical protein